MDNRIDRVLDGELSRDELTAAERVEADAYLAAANEAMEAVRSAAAPDLTPRVMAAIEDLQREVEASTGPRRLELLSWLLKSRPILVNWRPAYGALLLVLLASGTTWSVIGPTAPESGEVAVTLPSPAIYVQFRLDAPGARTVQLVGSFTDWSEGVELVETLPGVWSTLLPLEPGVHDYTFIVDGEVWVVDPLSPTIDDGFGGSKNRLFLTQPVENA